LVLTDHEAMREICRARPEGWRRPRNLERVFAEVNANGVFTAEGEAWKRQRRLMMAALGPRAIRGAGAPIRRTLGRLVGVWSGAARADTLIDAHADLQRFAVDVATSVAFGVDVNTVEKGSAELRDFIEPVFPKINERVNAVFPYWRWVRLPSDRAFDRAVGVLRERVGSLIADARKRLAADPTRATEPEGLLEAMLVARDEDDEALRVTDDELFANALTVLIAGEDTTSNTAAWMFDHLARAPAAQQRLREEVRGVFAGGAVPDDLATLRAFPFLDAVVQETLRVRSAAPLMFFEANTPQTLSATSRIGEILVDPHELVILLTRRAASVDATFSDGATWDPTRWLEEERAPDVAHDPSAMLAFGYGPRICPGRSLALLELALLAGAMADRFEFEAPEGPPPQEIFSFTMTPSSVRLRLRERT
jgi:cytochrome P450